MMRGDVMGFLDTLTGRKTEDAEETDYIEVMGGESKKKGNFLIRIEILNDFADVARIQQFVREGEIVWVKIKALREKDMMELKRAIDKLRKTCVAIDGDIAGVDEDFVVLTPPGVNVHRKE